MHYLVYYGIICVLFLAGSVQAQQRENAAQQESPKAEASVSPPAPSPVASKNPDVKQPKSPVQQSEAAKNEADRGWLGVTRAEGVQIGINALLFIVVLCQSVIYVQQRNAMRDTLEEMRTDRELANRAWIGIKKIATEIRPDTGVNFIATYVNSGNSPAMVAIRYRGEYLEKPPPDDFEFPPYETKGSKLTLFPHTEYEAVIASFPGFPFVSKGRNEQGWYLYGILDYTDIFGDTHVTRFAYRTVLIEEEVVAGVAPKGQKIPTLRLSETHNVFD